MHWCSEAATSPRTKDAFLRLTVSSVHPHWFMSVDSELQGQNLREQAPQAGATVRT